MARLVRGRLVYLLTCGCIVLAMIIAYRRYISPEVRDALRATYLQSDEPESGPDAAPPELTPPPDLK